MMHVQRIYNPHKQGSQKLVEKSYCLHFTGKGNKIPIRKFAQVFKRHLLHGLELNVIIWHIR